jgi:cytochrome c peroxidase
MMHPNKLRFAFLIIGLLCGLWVPGCSQASERSSAPPKAIPRKVAQTHNELSNPFNQFAYETARQAFQQLARVERELHDGCLPTQSYLTFRRLVARGRYWWRMLAPAGSDVLLGPFRPTNEGGGELGSLELSLTSHDCSQTTETVRQIKKALQLVQIETERRPGTLELGTHVLSDAVYEIGALAAESSQDAGLIPATLFADIHGMVQGVRWGVQILFQNIHDLVHSEQRDLRLQQFLDICSRLQGLEQRIEHAETTTILSERLSFVYQTGLIGAQLRSLAADAGWKVPPPYAPRVRTQPFPYLEPISVLTLPAPRVPLQPEAVSLGKKLFFDKILSKDHQRSCASCHRPKQAFSDNQKRSASLLPHQPLERHTPSLLYSAPQASFLWDGRITGAASQALRVIHSHQEMGLTTNELELRLQKHPTYPKEFSALFGTNWKAKQVGHVLAAFEDAELVPAAADIDLYAQGKIKELPEAARRGFDVFAAKARCSRCHVPPLFSGTRPNDFAVTIYAILGVPSTPNQAKLDPDLGRGAWSHVSQERYAFKTPTVRNIEKTAPYFHNGAFPTLSSVIEFYNKGGGKGIGIHLPLQDPDVRPLELSKQEKADLVYFLEHTLSDKNPESKANTNR